MFIPDSHYPEQIDPLIFFQDVDLEKLPTAEEYGALTDRGQYDAAHDLFRGQEGFPGYAADYFNAIENRIYSLQTYLQGKEKKKYFTVTEEADSEPDSFNQETIWL